MFDRTVRSPVAVVSTYPPRHCGLASYTSDLTAALRLAAPSLGPSVVAVDRDGLRYDANVVAVIDQHDEASYRTAGKALAGAGTRAVLIEHEFGIFGGPDGAHVLALADALRKHAVPYVVTLHTVLSHPSAHQLSILRQLCGGATRVTVFTGAARHVAALTGLAPLDKLVVLPHGAPLALVTAVDPEPLRPELAELDGAGPVLTTFGLISPGKGLDTAIRAVAQLVDRHPTVRYVVAGQTHPEVRRRDGEAYRTELVALVAQLGLGGHVKFVDAYLSVEELGALLRRTTVFVTPYRSAEQTCSGALTFALAAGRPVVSTAYQYARDMLGTGAGLLVPCGDTAGLATALDRFLADRRAWATAQGVALATSARLSWPAVARQAGESALTQPTAVITATVPDDDRHRWIASVHRRVGAYLHEVGVRPAGPPFARTYFQHVADLYGPRQSVVEAGFPTANPVLGDGVVEPSTLPEGPIAVSVHSGDPSDIDAAYDRLTRWLEERGCQLAGPPWEVYLIGPEDQPDPARWLTQIIAPCQPSPAEDTSADDTAPGGMSTLIIFGADGRHEQLV